MNYNITALFFCIDDFCKAFEEWEKHRLIDTGKKRHRSCEMSLSELLTIMILYHLSPCKNFKYFYLIHLSHFHKSDFPKLLSYTRFVQLMPRLFVPLCILLQNLYGEETGTYIADATSLPMCHNKRISRNRVFKGLASARFVLSSKLSAHLPMPEGPFSLRSWLENPNGGNLFITWREDMAVALRPLISAWIDVLCTSVLALDEDENRRLWMIIDELASLENIASLEDAATKGRKAGLRLVAGLQSTAQLDKIYGPESARTLRSCFRSLVVLGGAKTDPKTCEDMSLSLGEQEVERETTSTSTQKGSTSTSRQQHHTRERIVMPSEIASLPDLHGYLAFAGAYDIAQIKLTPMNFVNRLPGVAERERGCKLDCPV